MTASASHADDGKERQSLVNPSNRSFFAVEYDSKGDLKDRLKDYRCRIQWRRILVSVIALAVMALLALILVDLERAPSNHEGADEQPTQTIATSTQDLPQCVIEWMEFAKVPTPQNDWRENYPWWDDFQHFIFRQMPLERCRMPGVPLTADDRKRCECQNPIVPSPPPPNAPEWWSRPWPKAFQKNIELVETVRNGTLATPLDVVFLGDSITEQWNAMSLGRYIPNLEENRQAFYEYFQDQDLQGLALGVAVDRAPQLLYRVIQGKFLDMMPSVWWLLIGTNDILHSKCAVDQVAAGNIRIVEEILAAQTNATVVINSLLPVENFDNKMFPERWYDIYLPVNQRLQCYAESRGGNVHFFNATEIFLSPKEDGTDVRRVNSSMLMDGVHPSGLGSRVWGKAIMERVKEIARDV